MSAIVSFDDLLAAAPRQKPITYHCKAFGRDVLLRDPTSADLDAWRMYCQKNIGQDVPFAAKLLQILLCDADGERIVPQDDEALAAIGEMDAAGVAEIGEFAAGLMNSPTDDDIEEMQKN
jgi:hypothetical protein